MNLKLNSQGTYDIFFIGHICNICPLNLPKAILMQYFWIDKSLTNEDFEYTINRCYTSYMQQTNDVLFNLLDSHDTKRLRSDVKNLDEYYSNTAFQWHFDTKNKTIR